MSHAAEDVFDRGLGRPYQTVRGHLHDDVAHIRETVLHRWLHGALSVKHALLVNLRPQPHVVEPGPSADHLPQLPAVELDPSVVLGPVRVVESARPSQTSLRSHDGLAHQPRPAAHDVIQVARGLLLAAITLIGLQAGIGPCLVTHDRHDDITGLGLLPPKNKTHHRLGARSLLNYLLVATVIDQPRAPRRDLPKSLYSFPRLSSSFPLFGSHSSDWWTDSFRRPRVSESKPKASQSTSSPDSHS
ncbi:hypothetical protein EJ04DRAFT_356738 [Polyplosphaeria fusca]|uniref:Uncharacterized protein n=1 Tax=Polyplosphaeria fusca TaxID=682080 RepID=A0A9P4R4S5_9PLEO|nr:hypothetical protein EJ04DRAFT_356738 [Polyplosphaeria fusca]